MKLFYCLISGSFLLLSTLFCCAGATNVTVLHAFIGPTNGVNPDGANPAAGLVLFNGVLCGTTVNGGQKGAGMAFYLNPDGSGFNAFRSFTNAPDAGNPQTDLVFSGNRFYGASFGGGTNGVGTIFAGQTNGSVPVVSSFTTVNADTATNVGGASPNGQLVLSGGTFFGTAAAGGIYANGALFSVATNGSAYSVLHNFTVLDSVTGTNTDGAAPWGGLVLSGSTLYGTTSGGGAGGAGVVFSIQTNGNNFTTLYNFTAMDSVTGTNTDGAVPMAGLILCNGALYGTTIAGGFGDAGTVFSVGTNGSGFNVLHHFSAINALTGTNADGARPVAALILSSNTLYGTTSAGGAGASGTLFSVNTNGSQFKTLYSFTATTGTGTNADGAFPVSDLLLQGNSLIGTAFGGGPGSAGTVFSLALPLPPALITAIVCVSNSSVILYFAGSPNSTNYIQAATNLASGVIWQNISTNVADGSGLWQFTDTNTSVATNRFYRSYTR